MTLKSSDSRKWKSTQFNRSRKAGHNCLNHSLKAEVTAVEKASFIAACFRFSGWTCAAGPCRVEFMLKGNEAQNILHVALSVPWSFDFVAFSLAPCHCHANRGHNAKLATICGKLFRRFPIYYCTFSYRLYHQFHGENGSFGGETARVPSQGYHHFPYDSLTYSFCLLLQHKAIRMEHIILLWNVPIGVSYVSPFIPRRSMDWKVFVCFPIVRLNGWTACPSGWARALMAPRDILSTDIEGLG